jgi:hypothetical protein
MHQTECILWLTAGDVQLQLHVETAEGGQFSSKQWIWDNLLASALHSTCQTWKGAKDEEFKSLFIHIHDRPKDQTSAVVVLPRAGALR